MADAKISADTDVGALAGDEKIAIVKGGVNKTTTPDRIKELALTAGTIAAALGYTPADAANEGQPITLDEGAAVNQTLPAYPGTPLQLLAASYDGVNNNYLAIGGLWLIDLDTLTLYSANGRGGVGSARVPLTNLFSSNVTGLVLSAGNQAARQIGSGSNGRVTIQVNAAGTAGNDYTVETVDGVGNDVPLSVAIVGSDITVTRGTDSGGSPDASKNTALLVARAINAAVPSVQAFWSGNGSSVIPTHAQQSFTGGSGTVVNDAGVDAAAYSVNGVPLNFPITVRAVLTETEIATIAESPITLVPAPPAGHFVNPIAARGFLHVGDGGALATSFDIVACNSAAEGVPASGFAPGLLHRGNAARFFITLNRATRPDRKSVV